MWAVVLFSSLTLLGCAASDPWRNPSGEYSRSVVVNIAGVGKDWSAGYIERRVYYPKGLPIGLASNDSYLIGYKNSRLTENDREKIAIYRGLELGRSLGYSCMVITSENTLAAKSKVGGSSNSFQGTISVAPSMDGKSAYGSINLLGSGGVFELNTHRIMWPKCTNADSDIPGKNECTYFPRIDFYPVYYAIYPEQCRIGKDAESVKVLIDGHPDKDKFNVLDIDKKIKSYGALKRNILNER